MHVTEAVENYLEAILILSKQQPDVRATDICSHMGYSRPTISVALKGMKQNGLITVDTHNLITLTKDGQNIAEMIYERHRVLSHILLHLGVDEKTALEEACKIEHDISDHTFSCIKAYLDRHEIAY